MSARRKIGITWPDGRTMTEAMTELPPGAVLAKTWEDCAEHLEQHADMGGRVWWQETSGWWRPSDAGPRVYSGIPGAPGVGSWYPHALVPPKWRESRDPDELAAAFAAGVAVEVFDPGGDKWAPVALAMLADGGTANDFDLGVNRIGFRFRLPVSWEWEPCATELPVPEPRTERVPWWEAAGRIATDGRRINEVRHHHNGSPTAVTSAPTPDEFPVIAPDGTVEVLARDGES